MKAKGQKHCFTVNTKEALVADCSLPFIFLCHDGWAFTMQNVQKPKPFKWYDPY